MDDVAIENVDIGPLAGDGCFIGFYNSMFAFFYDFVNMNNYAGPDYHQSNIQNPETENFIVFGHYVEADCNDNPTDNTKLGKTQFEHSTSLHSALWLSLMALIFGIGTGAILGIFIGARK